jgi:peptidoglycan/xylan/chitin deacetylase (PgdA/CDA1 family)
MKILMIHEVRDWMLQLDLSEYDIITFDDGLYTQYLHYKHFLKFKKPLYFFVTTGITASEAEGQDKNVIAAAEAHDRYRDYGMTKHFMKWSQIHEIYNTPGCYIGGHGHTHIRVKDMPLPMQLELVANECIEMMNIFQSQEIKIDSFCFPYNDEVIGYAHYLKKFGIDKIFGKERIAIERI